MKYIPKCPVCDYALHIQDAEGASARGGRTVLTNIPCRRCPAKVDVFADSGFVCAFTPHQPLQVVVGRR